MGKILETFKGARKIELYLVAAGVALLLILIAPAASNSNSQKTQQEVRMQAILEKVYGAGRVDVMIAEDGRSVLVVAEGADDIGVCLRLQHAVMAVVDADACAIEIIPREK